jgi:hypothetical protein
MIGSDIIIWIRVRPNLARLVRSPPIASVDSQQVDLTCIMFLLLYLQTKEPLELSNNWCWTYQNIICKVYQQSHIHIIMGFDWYHRWRSCSTGMSSSLLKYFHLRSKVLPAAAAPYASAAVGQGVQVAESESFHFSQTRF